MKREKILVMHIITRLILGGAQENTILNARGLEQDNKFDVCIVAGPPIGQMGGREGSLVDIVKNWHIKYFEIPELQREVNPILDFIALKKLIKILKKISPDIVHTHSAKAGILGRIAAKLCTIPVIIHTIHGLSFYRGQNFLLKKIFILLERLTASFTDAFISVCDIMTKKTLQTRIGNNKPFYTIYSGIEIDNFQKKNGWCDVRGMYGIPESGVVVGKIARVSPLKGYEIAVPVAIEITKKYRGVYFIFVGDGALKNHFQDIIKENGVSDKFFFAGLVDTQYIPDYIRAMDIVMHTSQREGLPRVIPQASILRKPVVCLDVDGAPEVVKHGFNGFLVQENNISSLKVYLEELINNKELRRSMGENGHQLNLKRFDERIMIEQTKSLYLKLLTKKRMQF